MVGAEWLAQYCRACTFTLQQEQGRNSDLLQSVITGVKLLVVKLQASAATCALTQHYQGSHVSPIGSLDSFVHSYKTCPVRPAGPREEALTQESLDSITITASLLVHLVQTETVLDLLEHALSWAGQCRPGLAVRQSRVRRSPMKSMYGE